MLNEQQKTLWEQLKRTLSNEQRLWFAGFVQGMVSGDAGANVAPAVMQKLAIFFGTETGNSKMVAGQLAKALKSAGWQASIEPLKKTNPKALAGLKDPVVIITSTHGEGDPPEAAHAFFDALKVADEKLENLRYLVLGLGDRSYPKYNQAAIDIDTHLARMGAKTLLDRVDLDVDYNAHIPAWIKDVVKALPVQPSAAPSVMFTVEEEAPTGPGYSRLEPVKGKVADIVNLNDNGSAKETYHIEIEYDVPLKYAVGDAAGIILPHLEEGVDHLTPRLYSIASAPTVHENSVHLTVALAWHKKENGEIGYGLTSRYLADLKPGDEITFYIHRNHLFKLPEESRDMIMIGPGTGIAPFRGFVAERSAQNASGRNWLFFGEQHAHCDFLYQAEWQEHMQMGNLHAIDLAFSRDQKDKIYVQHRMQEKADEVFAWLEGGAALYVCGSKEPMSVDVEKTLKDIIAARKGSMEAAEAYLEQMHDEGRYIKDVY